MFDTIKNFFEPKANSELKEAVKSGAYMVDVRTRAEFRAGSVKGSVNIPLEELADSLSKFNGKKNIVVFCRTGNRSGHAKKFLERNGFQNVINGGSWQNVDQSVNQ